MVRKIIHIDMDAFYASVEQYDNPELKGKPIAVGGSRKRGVVAAASYEARKFGVRSAMPSITAAKKCPSLIFVKPRFERYKEVSQQIRSIFREYTDLVEPLSLDEAYLDVTDNKKEIKSAILIARQIREQIFETTGLTASAGVSVNKFVAKVASDINKPNGMKVILPEEVVPFLETLPVEKFFGVGKVTAQKMKRLGIHTGKDLKLLSLIEIVSRFGKPGKFYFNIVRGIDNRPVNPSRIRKSISVENTFSEDISSLDLLIEEMNSLSSVLEGRIERSGAKGKTLTIKMKSADFQIINRSKTVKFLILKAEQIAEIANQLLTEHYQADFPIRLLGVGIYNLENTSEEKWISRQLSLEFNYWL